MKWATRRGVHVDRAATAWLIRRCIDQEAEFVFVEDPDDVPDDATPFDMMGVTLSHRDEMVTFETVLTDYDITDPVMAEIGRIIHEADVADDRFDAPEAAGIDTIIRGLSLAETDGEILDITGRMFDGLYLAIDRRHRLLDRSTRAGTVRSEPANEESSMAAPDRVVNLAEKFAAFDDHWQPRIAGQMNDLDIRIVKIQGEFVWHVHDDTDEFFLVRRGQMTIEMEGRADAVLGAGEFFVVPRGVRHRPVAAEECEVLLLEPSHVVNTGDAVDSDMTTTAEWV